MMDEQAKLWNGTSGHAWVDAQELLDGMFAPFEGVLVEAALAGSGSRVLDIGCGTGATTLAVAKRLGTTGRSVGLDISEPMIELARARAKSAALPATFICADAQDYAFEPASFDTIISRFGVMFFEDAFAAFANLRRAVSDSGGVLLIAWRGPEDNPFMTTAERAAASLLPSIPPRKPGAPGQFAFADSSRVHDILEKSGWTSIDIRPLDVACRFPQSELVRYMTRLGPLGSALQHVDESTRTRVITTVRAAFEPFVEGDEVRFIAACWRIAARAGTKR